MEARFNTLYMAIVIIASVFLFQSSTSAADPGNRRLVNSADYTLYHEYVHQLPEPVNGFTEMTDGISYPVIALYTMTEGKVLLKAFIDEDGDVNEVQVIRGLGAGCDEAAVKAVEDTKFNPAIFDGKPVKAQVMIPVKFMIKK